MTAAADVIVDTLAAGGVHKVFGVVGTSTLDLADAIARDPRVEFVSARAEESAAHMADGYARATGQVGVVLCHVGPGALRQLYGVGTAWKDSVPLLALTGNEVPSMTDTHLREGYHVVDVLELYRPVTKATLQLRDGADAEATVARALWLAASGRPGPVLVDLPKSSLKQLVDPWQGGATHEVAVPARRPRPGREDVDMVADALRSASCPVIHAGGGVHWSAAADDLRDLAEQANLPVVTTDGGRGSIPEDHPLSLGVVARQAGDGVARRLLAEADVVVAIGTPFSDVSTFEWSAWSPECLVVQVDIAAEPVRKGLLRSRPVIADARAFVRDLAAELDTTGYRCPQDWRDRRAELTAERDEPLKAYSSGELVNPWHVVATLRDLLPRDTFVSVDSGMHSFFGKQLRVFEPRTYIRSAGFGAMGYSFPALLGAVEGVPGRRGIAIVGDGCMAMCLGELETAARRRSPVTVVVFNDAAYASQLSHQQRRFDGRATGTRFGTTDFAAIAAAQGVPGWTATTDAEAAEALTAAVADTGPNVVDVRVDPAVTPSRWIEGSGDERTGSVVA